MASRSGLASLSMSEKKQALVNHLDMDLETYALMAKEADRVYNWLTSEKRHLKKNCKRKPPYDWSDIAEKSKDEAMARIAESGDAHTSYYWNLAVPTEECPNWIARWFLYHKFRYRDGRNRNPVSAEEKRHSSHGSSSKYSHHKHSEVGKEEDGYYDSQTTYHPAMSTNSVPTVQSNPGYSHATAGLSAPSTGYTYETGQLYNTSYQRHAPEGRESKTPYDPVRDI